MVRSAQTRATTGVMTSQSKPRRASHWARRVVKVAWSSSPQLRGAFAGGAVCVGFGRLAERRDGRLRADARDAVLRELRPEQPRPAWSERLPLLDPILGKGAIVDQAVVAQLRQHTLHHLRVGTRPSQALAYLVFTSGPAGQVADRRVERVGV